MPYVRHDKFHDYFNRFDARELQMYMRNLLLALRRVHSFGIIHRDVKPSNFLHDRKNMKYLLVDFGLAQIVHRSGGSIQRAITAAPMQATGPIVFTALNIVAGSTRLARSTSFSVDSHGPGAQKIGGGDLATHQLSLRNSRNNPSNSQSVGVMKKRKAAEIEETENSSNAPAKRPRHQLNPQHHHNTHQNQHQYLSVGATSAAAAGTDNQNENPDGRQTLTSSVAPLSPFKTPLKQINAISTPKNLLRSQRYETIVNVWSADYNLYHFLFSIQVRCASDASCQVGRDRLQY